MESEGVGGGWWLTSILTLHVCLGPFKCYVTQWDVEGVKFPEQKRYEGVRFNVISVTRGG